MLTGEQLRGARAMLKMEQAELATMAGVSVETVKRLERINGPVIAITTTLENLQRALEAEGVVFMAADDIGAGVRLRREPPPQIRTRKLRGAS